MSDRPLRVGLMLDSYSSSFWVERVIDWMLANPRISIELVVLNGLREVKSKRTLLQRLTKNHFLFYRFMRMDWARTRRRTGNAYEDRSIESKLKSIATLTVTPQGSKFVHRFEAADVEKIRAHDLDVMVRFGFKIIKGEILQTARYGVWSYHHGDNDLYRGGPAGFWEVYEQNPVSGITLQVLTEELDGGFVLGKTNIRTDLNSPAMNNTNLRLAGGRLIRDALDRLAQRRPSPEQFFANLAPSRSYTRRIFRTPTNSEMVRFLGGVIVPGVIRRKLSRPSDHVQWNIGVLSSRAGNDGAGKGNTASDFVPDSPRVSWFPLGDERFLADPFPIERDGRLYLFVEDFDYTRDKGHISVIEVGKDLQYSAPTTVVEEPYHLSFPFLFSHEGKLYMIPEQAKAGNLYAYECVEFPKVWRKGPVVLEKTDCVDSVLYQQDGLWWLFTTKTEFGFGQNNLYIYYSTNPFGEWTAHPKNPVKNTVRGSRMGGAMFRKAGKLVRPSQNCEQRYGGAIIFHDVIKLTVDEYQEVELQEITPDQLGVDWNTSLHTFNQLSGITAVDGGRLRLRKV